ncbi:MAG: MarR family transcriptional regulator [Bacteroidota bacterium]
MKNITHEPKDSMGYLTNMTGKMMSSRLKSKLEAIGIDLPIEHWIILTTLWFDDGLNQQEVADKIHKNKGTITRAINHLEQINLVVRIPDQKDKRLKRIYLTHKGKELQATLLPLAYETNLEAVEGISEAELDICKKVLRKMYQNLNQSLS